MVKDWVELLRLNHWKFKIIIGDDDVSDGCSAHIVMANDYNSATISFGPDWHSWSLDQLEEIVVHELLHAHIHQLKNAAMEAKPAFGFDAAALYENRLDHEVEAAVETLAQVFIKVVQAE